MSPVQPWPYGFEQEFQKLYPKMNNIEKKKCRKSFGIAKFRFHTWKDFLGVRKGGVENSSFSMFICNIGEILKLGDHQQVLGIYQTARGMEPVLARNSWHPCASLKAMSWDRQQAKLENKLSSQYLCIGPHKPNTISAREVQKGHKGAKGKKTRTKKRRGERSMPLPAESSFALLCMLLLS